MAFLNTYLNFNGTAEAAFNFYKSVSAGFHFRCPLPLGRNRSKVEVLFLHFDFVRGFISD